MKIHESQEKLKLNSLSLSGEYFLDLLSGMKDKERFVVAFMDNGNNVIETKTMSDACDSSAIILAHNHRRTNM